MDAASWAADLLLARADAAADHTCSTYGGTQRLAVHGRALLLDEVQRHLSVRDYPVDTTDDWRDDADAAYEAARQRWAAGGSDEDVRAAARSAAAEQQAERWAEQAHPDEIRRYRQMASGAAVLAPRIRR